MAGKTERAIVHFDGDSFFASIEQALNYTLRGKPVVTGAERGAATSVSYEAKRMGVTRNMSLRDMKKMCPDIVVVNSDYRAYSIYAGRMYKIVRRYTSMVEEYSVDECFADITGLDKAYGLSYAEVAQMIKRALEQALGITYGVGLAPTKVLAKCASKFNKPAGFTHMSKDLRENYLATIAIGSVWGIGPSMSFVLIQLGVTTALEFAQQSREWLEQHDIAKPYRAIWYELNGTLVHELSVRQANETQSIMKTRTFSPPSSNKSFIYSQLAKNVERACERARLYKVRAKAITFYVKTQEFFYGRVELDLAAATDDPRILMRVIAPHFEKIYRPHTLYRATGITLRSIVPEEAVTADLFGEGRKQERVEVLASIDSINRRFGSQTVFMGESMQAVNYREVSKVKKAGKRAAFMKVPMEIKRKSIDMPFLGLVT